MDKVMSEDSMIPLCDNKKCGFHHVDVEPQEIFVLIDDFDALHAGKDVIPARQDHTRFVERKEYLFQDASGNEKKLVFCEVCYTVLSMVGK